MEEKNKLALIKWENICKPKELGGLGIKNLNWKNEALGTKLVWKIHQERNGKWDKIMYHIYYYFFDPTSLFRVRNPPKGSEFWNL